MTKRELTGAIVDTLLKFLLTGGTFGAALIAPNILIGLDKPLQRAFDKLDARERERELKRVLNYMKRKDLINTANYQHGIKITRAGRRRVNKTHFQSLIIPTPKKWDENWRIVFFDIPEAKRQNRNQFIRKLRNIGFMPLQRSTWIHPFPCREQIEVIARTYDIEKYITYIETSHIDNQTVLRKRFKKLFKK